MPVGVSTGERDAIAVVEGAGAGISWGSMSGSLKSGVASESAGRSVRSDCVSSIADSGSTSADDGVRCDSLRVVWASTFESPEFVVAFRFRS